MVHVKDQIDPLPFRPLAIWSDYPGRSGVSAGTINAGWPHRAVPNACAPLTAPYGQAGTSLELTVSCLVREKILVTPSAALMFHHSAKSPPEADQPLAERGVPRLGIQLKSGATKTRSHKVSQKGTKSKSFSLCFGDFVAKMMFSTAFLEPLHENLPGSFLGLQQT